MSPFHFPECLPMTGADVWSDHGLAILNNQGVRSVPEVSLKNIRHDKLSGA